MEDDQAQPPDSLLPYDEWHEEALRHVMVRALQYAAANGLPGGHHFYLTFRTGAPGVVIPARLKAQYPDEMTIVLQHQFWDMQVDETAGVFSVGLSFGGVPSTLRIPLSAIIAFADPFVRTGMRFSNDAAAEDTPDEKAEQDAPQPDAGAEAETPDETPAEAPQVVSLDAFRRRSPKE
jgi:uncharacterized protein